MARSACKISDLFVGFLGKICALERLCGTSGEDPLISRWDILARCVCVCAGSLGRAIRATKVRRGFADLGQFGLLSLCRGALLEPELWVGRSAVLKIRSPEGERSLSMFQIRTASQRERSDPPKVRGGFTFNVQNAPRATVRASDRQSAAGSLAMYKIRTAPQRDRSGPPAGQLHMNISQGNFRTSLRSRPAPQKEHFLGHNWF